MPWPASSATPVGTASPARPPLTACAQARSPRPQRLVLTSPRPCPELHATLPAARGGQCSAPQDPGTLTPKGKALHALELGSGSARSALHGARSGQGRTRRCVLFSAPESRWFQSKTVREPQGPFPLRPRHTGAASDWPPRGREPSEGGECHRCQGWAAPRSSCSRLSVWILARGGCAWQALPASSPAALGSPDPHKASRFSPPLSS